MKEINLTQGRVAVVDDADLEDLARRRWHVSPRPNGKAYAISKNDRKTVYMHRVILNAPRGMCVDHINGDGLDNRRANLRICTYSQNLRNGRRHKDSGSAFKGVTWDKKNRKWKAQIRANGRNINLGRFANLQEAACAYDTAARQYFGVFALLNFPCGGEVNVSHSTPGRVK